jgi:hypothetical protein
VEIGECEKVAGAINRVYWCRLFARAMEQTVSLEKDVKQMIP